MLLKRHRSTHVVEPGFCGFPFDLSKQQGNSEQTIALPNQKSLLIYLQFAFQMTGRFLLGCQNLLICTLRKHFRQSLQNVNNFFSKICLLQTLCLFDKDH